MNARFYVPGIARFASADTLVPDPTNPQAFNRYSYVNNNPIRLTDPSGHYAQEADENNCSIRLCGVQPPPDPDGYTAWLKKRISFLKRTDGDAELIQGFEHELWILEGGITKTLEENGLSIQWQHKPLPKFTVSGPDLNDIKASYSVTGSLLGIPLVDNLCTGGDCYALSYSFSRNATGQTFFSISAIPASTQAKNKVLGINVETGLQMSLTINLDTNDISYSERIYFKVGLGRARYGLRQNLGKAQAPEWLLDIITPRTFALT